MSEPLTLFDKLWAAHEIVRRDDDEALLWVDRHYVHEGSFNAFSQIKARGAQLEYDEVVADLLGHRAEIAQ